MPRDVAVTSGTTLTYLDFLATPTCYSEHIKGWFMMGQHPNQIGGWRWSV